MKKLKKCFPLNFELYREGKISLGKACELAEITKWEFFEMNKKAKIPFNITEEDWKEDKEKIRDL